MVITSDRFEGVSERSMLPLMSTVSLRTGRLATKGYRRGTDRIVSPEQTLASVAPFLPDFGITRVADVTGMDCIGIPTVMVVRPNSRSVSVSQGKGADLISAKVSGVMESIEQFHAEHVLLPLRLGSLQDINASGKAANVERFARFERPYDVTQRILWIAGQDLSANGEVWVPFEAVNLDLRLPLPTGSGYFMSGSNGLASGNHRLEAISHGLCELIERDALSLFFTADTTYQRTHRLDLETVDDPVCLDLLDKYRCAEISVAVWDITSDLGIPCFLCWILETAHNVFRPVGLAQGSGCHPTRTVALARALSEAAQSRVTRIVGSRDDLQPHELSELRSSDTLRLHRAQLALPTGKCCCFQDVPSYDFDTLEADVALLIDRLRAVGVDQVVSVDLSRPEYPVHVVRVFTPGLEGAPYLPGYQPGRRASTYWASRAEASAS